MEAVIREELTLRGYDIVELFLELVSVRVPLMEKGKEMPPDMMEAIASLIYAGGAGRGGRRGGGAGGRGGACAWWGVQGAGCGLWACGRGLVGGRGLCCEQCVCGGRGSMCACLVGVGGFRAVWCFQSSAPLLALRWAISSRACVPPARPSQRLLNLRQHLPARAHTQHMRARRPRHKHSRL